jgi:choline dehydrogenase-like flavoprotein
MNKQFEYVVIGSGAGGSALAHELSKKGKSILIIESGGEVNKKHLGSFRHQVFFPGYYAKFAAFNLSQELSTIYCSHNVGGTTVVSCGNMVRSLQAKLLSMGIDLEPHFQDAEKDICILPVKERSNFGGTRAIIEASKRIGIEMTPMPKGINPDFACNSCGDCVLGCRREAKWDARSYINSALKNGAKLRPLTKASRVVFNGNREVVGVEIIGQSRRKEIVEAGKVILSAGGVGTPVILQRSGIDAGSGLFVDFFNTTYGLSDSLSQVRGISMGAVADFRKSGYILSPYVDHWSQIALFCPLRWNLTRKAKKMSYVGIMAKISDERRGRVFMNGKISKYPTDSDFEKLHLGAQTAKRILHEAGAKNLVTTHHPRGAHPGGTAAIGEVVDTRLSVLGCKNLYVCDASVLPESPGLPPILTITALAKYLGNILNAD